MSTYIGNNEISGIYVGNSEITSIYVGTDLVYSGGTTPPTPTGDTTNYLCFTAQQDNSTVALSKNGTNTPTITLEYSLDKVNWNTWDRSAFTLNSGNTMYLRGDNANFSNYTNRYYQFVMSGKIAASGSIMTLLDKTDTLRTVKNYMFFKLFQNCTSLTTAPELPATTLGDYCYRYLFNGCTNLTTAPSILPATTLTTYCYSDMFVGCTSLTTVPELPATTLTTYCYNRLFFECNSLNYIKIYATDISASGCLAYWTQHVANSGTFYNYGGATYPSGFSGIPDGWTEVTQ